MSFGYWALNQFNSALNSLSASFASTHLVYPSFKQNTELASTSLETFGELTASAGSELASTSSETLVELATSTDSTGSPQASSEQAAPTDLKPSFTFPQKDTGVYIGCTYPISWQSSTTIDSLEIALIDAGTGEAAGPIASGLAKKNTIEKDLQNLNWKVGVVWPGAYYIKVSKINGVEAEFKSNAFEINRIPTNISTDKQENICKESGGSF